MWQILSLILLISCVPQTAPENTFRKPIKIDTRNAPVVSETQTKTVRITGDYWPIGAVEAGSDLEDGTFLNYLIITLPTKGVLKDCLGLGGKGSDLECLYKPNAGVSGDGADFFEYFVIDSSGKESRTKVILNILALEDLTTISNQSVTLAENGGFQSLTLSSSSTVEGTIAYVLITAPKKGSLKDCLGLKGASNTDLTCLYSPNANSFGTSFDSFVYAATTGDGRVQQATVTIHVTTNNTSPVFGGSPLTSSVKKNSGATALTALSGGTDADGDSIAYALTSTPSIGTLSGCLGLSGALPSDLNCDYMPNADVTGTDSFIYQVTDTEGLVATNSMSISIFNTVPTVSSQTVTVTENPYGGGTQTFSVTATDADVGDTLTYTIETYPTKGVLTNCDNIGPTSSSSIICSYNPSTNVAGSAIDSFIFKVEDSSKDSSTDTVYFDITNVNDGPVISSDSFSVIENSGLNILTLTGATDVDVGDTLSYAVTVDVNASAGTLSQCLGKNSSANTDLICEFTPANNFDGSATFSYTVTDAASSSATTTVDITVVGTNSPPVMYNQRGSFLYNNVTTPFTISTAFDADGDLLTYSAIINSATNLYSINTIASCLHYAGTASSTSDLDCTYLPSNTAGSPVGVGSDFLLLKVEDGKGGSDFSIYNFDIYDTAASPVTSTPTITSTEDTVSTFTINGTFVSDANNYDVLSFRKFVSEKGGTNNTCMPDATYNTDTSCEFTPFLNHVGISTMSYDVKDLSNNTARGTFYVNHAAVNDPPILTSTKNITLPMRATTLLELGMDEGGGSDEDTQNISFKIESSTPSVLTSTEVEVWVGSSFSSSTNFSVSSASFTAITTNSADVSGTKIFLKFPSKDFLNDSDTNLTLTISDSQALLPTDTETINVKYVAMFSSHEGWTKILSKGRKYGYNFATSTVPIVYSSASVTLGWNAFTFTNLGTSVFSGNYAIYRSSTTDDLGLDDPIGQSSGTSYTDTSSSISSVTSSPVAYYYEVRPIMNYLGSNTTTFSLTSTDSFSQLRVVVPQDNYIFVHRASANYEMCSKLGFTKSAEFNNRCLYNGPGASTASGVTNGTFYDIGYDFLIGQAEVGCPVTFDCTGLVNKSCHTRTTSTENTPVGTVFPSVTTSFFYARKNGRCYASTGVLNTSWAYIAERTTTLGDFSNTTTHFMTGLPPLVEFTQEEAGRFCRSSNLNKTVTNISPGAITADLPTRKEYMVASLWDRSNSNAITRTKLDYPSVASQPERACNSSEGKRNHADTTVDIVTSVNANFGAISAEKAYRFPYSSDTSPHSYVTASTGSANCVSFFGAQDMVGNVREWVTDRIHCSSTGSCVSTSALNSVSTEFDFPYYDGSSILFEGFDYTSGGIGPFPTFSTEPFNSWAISNGDYADTTNFFIPMGYPTRSVDSAFTLTTSTGDYNVTYGDYFGVNATAVYGGTSSIGAATAGGDWTSTDGSGVYNTQFRPKEERNFKTGFRCLYRLPN